MPPPIIDRLSPSAGWPGSSTVQGTLVIIHGRNFHPTSEMHSNQVTFAASAGGTVPATVEWASVNEIDYQPNGVVASNSTVPSGLDGPRGVAVNSATGVLYIADTGNDRIVRRSTAGSFSTWGSTGSGNGQFNRPTGIAVDNNGDIYVADTMNHRIQKFNANGAFITAWGSHGSGLGQFDMPTDVDVALIGSMTFVYVADSNNHRVARSDGNGNMPTQLPAPADSGRILGVCAPRGYGFVYATDPSNKRIYRWAWMGVFNGYFGDPGPHNLAVVEVGYPMGIEQDFDGYVYITDNGGRVVRKFDPFDPNFREIAKFGLTIPSVPGPTPIDEFVDPVDIAVTDLKAAYIVDRQRKQIVRYTPSDSQELWVHVPEGTVSGNLRVRTDNGADNRWFIVPQRAQVQVADAYLTQGLMQYPLVAGKKTIIRYQLRTVGATSIDTYSWGSPVHDSAVCRIFKDGSEIHQVPGVPEFKTMSGGAMGSEIAFEIHFDIPHWAINEEASYRFRVTLRRTGTPAFSDTRDLPSASGATFRNRKNYRIIASPVTHLRHDGARVSSGSMYPALFYVGTNIGHMLDWMDWSQLYSGYMHYNRLYPLRYSVADIVDWGIWINNTLHNGINSDDEVRDMLEVLEYTRRDINEGGGPNYDYMLGIVDRNEVAGSQNWLGVTSDAYRSALISVGQNLSGDPAFDVGAIIGHELLHQHGLHHQGSRERAQSDKEAWNSVTGKFERDPVTLRYVSSTGSRTFDWNDETAFAEGRHNSTPGSYEQLFDALANPHPVRMRVREQALAATERPPSSPHNFNLVGHLKRSGEFIRAASWVGRGDTSVTPEAADSEGCLVFYDTAGAELLRWRLRITFGLRTTTKSGKPGHTIGKDSAAVSVTCPFPEATAQLDLILGDQTVWQAEVPGEAPTVQLITPRGGEHIAPTDTLIVEWQAGHPQGMELSYSVGYSFDGGETFRPLAVGLKETHYEGQAGLAASGGRIRLRIVASDGFNQSSDVSDDIHVEDVARRVAIIQPRRGEVIPEGKPIRLTALANDLEHGALQLTAGNTRWMLDNDVILGSGNDIDVKEIELTTPLGTLSTPLTVGPHCLNVEVTLGTGKKLADEIPIEIAADSDRDGVPDEVEIERGTDPNDPGNRSSVAPIYPFGQWRFRRWRNHTLFQISHLATGEAVLELGFVDETGVPLAGHQLTVVRGASRSTLVTDTDGWMQLPLGSLQTLLLKLPANPAHRSGFGSCRLRLAKVSSLTETVIQAHAWISRQHGCCGFGRESQGTILINAGKPLAIRGAKSWKASSPRMKIPALNHRLLGRLQMATQRLSKHSSEIDCLSNRPVKVKK
ncbi:MAG: hypothetical protein L3J88_09940 [Gammaproteobacteria bacterium]|nr:hypothetical protein [Gammaproteobacteria bacterium]MCF6363642.1 hypothetical protein [Gammaproteobacteria bacterium]